MGLFSFLKNAGAKLFNKDEAPKNSSADKAAEDVANRQKATLLKNLVASMKLEVENLQVSFDGETAHVSGQVASQADRERVILTVGNVNGVAAVNDSLTVVKQEPEADFYEVKRGDSLSKIARHHYGDAMKYGIIFDANKPMLKDPNLIYPGQVLRIPKLTK